MDFREMTPEQRRDFVKSKTSSALDCIAKTDITADFEGRNIENMIGAAQIPMGVVKLTVNGAERLVPLATTEGALVASTSRGAKAAKNITSVVTKNAMTRAPAFKTSSIKESVRAAEWITENYAEVKAEAEKESKHLKLLSITPHYVGRSLFLRMEFFTGDAMGMNMITIGCENACRLIQEKTGATLVALSGNLCTDKKPAGINVVNGRGKSCVAECIITRSDCEKVLKTTPERIVEVNYAKNFLGSAKAASLGFNAHHANMAAAFFIATGQDPAQVVEASLGITTAEMDGEDLYFSVSMPAIELGIVGGGTRLPTQKEALAIIGAKSSVELAEILCATVLCGELSLLAALSSGALAAAHKKLGR